MSRKVNSQFFMNTDLSPQHFDGPLGTTTVLVEDEEQERRTVACDDVTIVLPSHASLRGILNGVADGVRVVLDYDGMVGPESKKYKKPTAMWTAEIFD